MVVTGTWTTELENSHIWRQYTETDIVTGMPSEHSGDIHDATTKRHFAVTWCGVKSCKASFSEGMPEYLWIKSR